MVSFESTNQLFSNTKCVGSDFNYQYFQKYLGAVRGDNRNIGKKLIKKLMQN